MALLTNAVAWVVSRWRSSYLLHGGMAMILLGIIVSANFSTTERVVLGTGEVGQALGREIRYLRATLSGLELELTGQGGSFKAFPRIVSQGGEMVRKPHVNRGLLNDVYITPLGLQYDWGPSLSVGKGETVVHGGYEVTFHGFDLKGHQGGRGGHPTDYRRDGAEHWWCLPSPLDLMVGSRK